MTEPKAIFMPDLDQPILTIDVVASGLAVEIESDDNLLRVVIPANQASLVKEAVDQACEWLAAHPDAPLFAEAAND